MNTRKKREITPFGRDIKMKLLKKGLSQRDFCRSHNIPETRLSEIMYGNNKLNHYRRVIIEELEIKI